ncbi:opticin isoform X2 [Carettochelys insculpta]|uniref:opticin isoform X2 n=1 Tax=Carettochelys insculpta TaxID=44489 RepID=UPI003EB78E5A
MPCMCISSHRSASSHVVLREPHALHDAFPKPRSGMQILTWLGVTALALALAAPPKEGGEKEKEKPGTDVATYDDLDLPSYLLNLDNYDEIFDPSFYEEIYDYRDPVPQVEVGTLASPTRHLESVGSTRAMLTDAPTRPPSTSPPLGPGLLGSIIKQGLPTCLVCVCLGTSVYCDDADLEQIPPLPLETTYLYARFNHISHIRVSDFARLKKLKRIDLTSNAISWVDKDSFRQLGALQELILAENRLPLLPALPSSIVSLDARLNRIRSSGIRPEAFLELKKLQFLYLSDNKLDYIPVPLPEGLRALHLQNNNIQTLHVDTFCDSQDHSHIRWALEDIRLDGNPINLSLFPDAYFCLPRIPTGHFY